MCEIKCPWCNARFCDLDDLEGPYIALCESCESFFKIEVEGKTVISQKKSPKKKSITRLVSGEILYLHLNDSYTLSSFEGLPKKMPEVETIICENIPLTSLYGLPEKLPALQILHLEDIPLSSFAGFSEHTPMLHQITIRNCHLTSLHRFPRRSTSSFLAMFHPERTPWKRPESWSSSTDGVKIPPFFNLSHKGADLLATCLEEEFQGDVGEQRNLSGRDRLIQIFLSVLAPDSSPKASDKLFDYYQASPLELTRLYLSHCISGAEISEEAIERLKHEGGPTERKLLENELPVPQEDSVLQTIQTRLSVTLPHGHSLLL